MRDLICIEIYFIIRLHFLYFEKTINVRTDKKKENTLVDIAYKGSLNLTNVVYVMVMCFDS